jgi:hypothetical protein
MILAKIVGKAYIPMLDSSEVAAWAAETPLSDDLVFDTSTGSFLAADGAGSYTAYDVQKVFKEDSNPNTGTATYTWSASKGILAFFKNQTILRVVGGTPANATEVQYDSTTGDFTLFTGQTFNGEWVSILYDNYLIV